MEFAPFSLNLTLVIIIITVILSIAGFNNQKVIDDLIFYPPAISRRKQWYRFITCGFIHADVLHLAFNMYAFYMFGGTVEKKFQEIFTEQGKILYLVLYLSALVVALLPTYLKNLDNYYYKSLGASGAVAAVVFTFIMLDPMRGIGLIFIPGIFIPAFIFAIIYLAVSAWLDKRGGGSINHSAHFWGSVYGIVFILATSYLLTDKRIIEEFLKKIQEWLS